MAGNVFRKDGMEYLPLYEAKMTQIFNHRAADVVVSDRARQRKAQPSTLGSAELGDPYRGAMPLYWVDEQECVRAISDRWDRHWLMGFSNVTSPTNERSMNPVVFPRSGVGNSMPVVLGTREPADYPVLYANMCAFVFDYAVRHKVGGINLNFFLLNQCPVLSVERPDETCPWYPPQSIRDWITVRASCPTPLGTSSHSLRTADGGEHRFSGTTTAASCYAASWTLLFFTCTCRPTTMAAGAPPTAPTVAPVMKRPNNLPSSSVGSPHLATLSDTSWTSSPLFAAMTSTNAEIVVQNGPLLKSMTPCGNPY